MSLDPQAAAPAAWTVLVYMAADNNLAGAADACLSAMESIAGAEGVNVVVEIHRPGPPRHGPTTVSYTHLTLPTNREV